MPSSIFLKFINDFQIEKNNQNCQNQHKVKSYECMLIRQLSGKKLCI